MSVSWATFWKHFNRHFWVSLIFYVYVGTHSGSRYINGICASPSPVVLHGNNLLVFGGTGIPFGESNGNDVHVCNVKYKRWALLSCRGKKPSRIYGQVPIHGWPWRMCLFGSFKFWGQTMSESFYYYRFLKWTVNWLWLILDFLVLIWNFNL